MPKSLLFFFLLCFLNFLMAFPCEVYFNNFDGTQSFYSQVTGGMSGITSIESVANYAGKGPTGNTFSGYFLRNSSSGNPASSTILTLNNLPEHDALHINFLLAIIDTWDGDTTPYGPDILSIKVDGNVIFSHNPRTYANASSLLVTTGTNLGFNTPADSGYNMYLEDSLKNIPHISSSLVIEWYAGGAGWQGGADESFALENLQIVLNVPEPGSLVFLCLTCLALGWIKYKH